MSINKTTIFESESAPGGEPGAMELVVLDDGGTPQLFAQDENDVLYQLTPTSTGSSESAANVFTFRPSSGLTGPLVFDTFDDLYNVLDAIRSTNDNSGKYRVICDDQDVGGPGNTVLLESPAGNVTYDFNLIELVGVHEDQNVLLDIADAGGETDSLTIINALWFEGLTIRAAGQDTAFDAQADQTFTLKRTTFDGDGEYVLDVLGVTGCVVHMDDESRLQRTTNAAIRVNTVALIIHVTGNGCTIDNLGVAGFVGGSVSILIDSSSAQVDPQQDILLQSFTMRSAAGYWSADPNTDLVAQQGTLVSDENTGTVWRNTNGATAWSAFGTAGGFTQGSILFADALGNITEDNAGLFYDDLNNFVGIGFNTPTTPLGVLGDVDIYAGTLTTFGGGSVYITGPGELRTDQIQHSTFPGGSTPIDIMVPISVRGGIAKFWGPIFNSEGHIYLDPADSPSAPSLGFGWDTNSTLTGYINDKGYQAGITQFRNLEIRDGKGAQLAFFDGSTKAAVFGGVGTLPPANSVAIVGGLEVYTNASEEIFFGANRETFWMGGVGITSMGTNYNTNAGATMFINDVGYLGGITQFRDFQVNDGKGASVMNLAGATKLATFGGSIDMATSLFRGGTKVVGAQGAAVADAAGGVVIDAEARTAINTLLARLRAATGHGLIA
jgi:hypothetical protein